VNRRGLDRAPGEEVPPVRKRDEEADPFAGVGEPVEQAVGGDGQETDRREGSGVAPPRGRRSTKSPFLVPTRSSASETFPTSGRPPGLDLAPGTAGVLTLTPRSILQKRFRWQVFIGRSYPLGYVTPR